jgi:hypothetical protein
MVDLEEIEEVDKTHETYVSVFFKMFWWFLELDREY